MRTLILVLSFSSAVAVAGGGRHGGGSAGGHAGGFSGGGSSFRASAGPVNPNLNWHNYTPSWRTGYLSYPIQRYGVSPYVAPYYGYGYGYGAYGYPSAYPPYGSTYYGFQPTNQQQQQQQEPQYEPEPQPPPTQTVIIEPQIPVQGPPQQQQPFQPQQAPAPQVIVVEVPAPAPAAPVTPAPPPVPSGPPKEVYHWVDANNVHHYSTSVPPEWRGRAEKVGPK